MHGPVLRHILSENTRKYFRNNFLKITILNSGNDKEVKRRVHSNRYKKGYVCG